MYMYTYSVRRAAAASAQRSEPELHRQQRVGDVGPVPVRDGALPGRRDPDQRDV